ncbi:MAG: Nif3-like dinuclear metal center hexameric protein [Clostridium sp.]|uniref:Nif3-like dinuclear metal center hexameric protein n=1 Tax=Clostridium sp. TaxID=1506 RepID=UPI003EE57734
MDILINDIINKMEEFAPSEIKESFDNVGLMVGDSKGKVQRVLLALDCTMDVIDEAIEKKCELIITHHPLIFKKPSRIVQGDLLGDKIIKLIKNNISVYSSHTNLDSAVNGINKEIVNKIGFNKSIIMDKGVEENIGIGRFVSLDKPIKATEIIGSIKKNLEIANIKGCIGQREIKNIAIINGSGSSYFEKAYEMGADCIISGDISYHYLLDYKELGLTIIDAGHFNTEWLVFLDVVKNAIKEIKGITFIKSEKTKDPYEFL